MRKKERRNMIMETIQNGKWHWYNVMGDLEKQGGVKAIIEPTSVSDYGCAGKTEKGTVFTITWVHNKFLLLSMSQEEPKLVEAFSTVVGYDPFCRYVSKKSGLRTYEWDKINPEGRFASLQDEKEPNLEKVCCVLGRIDSEEFFLSLQNEKRT
jgi:hypothetical protein